MSESRIPYRKRKGQEVPSPREDAIKDAMPDVQPPSRVKKIRGPEEMVADSDEDDD